MGSQPLESDKADRSSMASRAEAEGDQASKQAQATRFHMVGLFLS